MKNKLGYTFLELVLVIGIIMTVTMISFPSINNLVKYNKEEISIRNLIFDMNSCLINAIAEKRTYKIEFNCSNESYTVYKRINSTEFVEVKFESMHKGIDINSTSFNSKNTDEYPPNTVAYSANGTPSSAGTIYIRRSNGKRQEITVTVATGRTILKND